MKKLIMFLAGLVLLALTGIAIYFAGGIFDAGQKQTVRTYFFQPNNLSSMRPGVPQTAEYMGENQFLDLLVRKYIAEYFYAAPDAENIARRTSANSALAQMSSPAVFEEWNNNEAQAIQKLAENKSMRTAHVIDSIFRPNGSKYWVVNYELKTWEKPNDFNLAPVVTRGTMYMDIVYEMGMRNGVSVDEIHQYLEEGNDPAAVFKFLVKQIIQGQ